MRTGLMIFAMLAGVLCNGAAVDPPFRLDLHAYAGELELNYWGRSLALYEFGAELRRPALLYLSALDGRRVLQAGDSESHGMALGLKINDLVFWGEGEGTGWQRSGPEVERRIGRDPKGRLRAEVAHTVYWLPTEPPALPAGNAWLVENRRLRFLVSESDGEIALNWDSSFRVPEETGELKVGASEGVGLGLLWAQGLEGTVLSTPSWETNLTDLPPGRFPASGWISLFKEVDGRPLSLTVYLEGQEKDEPQPLCSLEKTGQLMIQPRVGSGLARLPAGYRFRMRFLVTAHLRRLTPDGLNRRRADWLGEIPPAG